MRLERGTQADLLNGCVVAQSGIGGRLRVFLARLCTAMGGVSQETFARKTVCARS